MKKVFKNLNDWLFRFHFKIKMKRLDNQNLSVLRQVIDNAVQDRQVNEILVALLSNKEMLKFHYIGIESKNNLLGIHAKFNPEISMIYTTIIGMYAEIERLNEQLKQQDESRN